MGERGQITVSISMDYIVWLLTAQPDELSEGEKFWVETFRQLWKEKINETQAMLQNRES